MANMKTTSMVARRYRQLQAETQNDIATAPSVVEGELNDIAARLEQLRSEMMGEHAGSPMKPQFAPGRQGQTDRTRRAPGGAT